MYLNVIRNYQNIKEIKFVLFKISIDLSSRWRPAEQTENDQIISSGCWSSGCWDWLISRHPQLLIG